MATVTIRREGFRENLLICEFKKDNLPEELRDRIVRKLRNRCPEILSTAWRRYGRTLLIRIKATELHAAAQLTIEQQVQKVY